MQVVSSESIVLRNQDYLERDRLVTFLARDAGRLRGIVRGSRKLTSRGVGDFEPFSRGVMHYTDRGHGGLVTIRKCDPRPPYLYLHGNYQRFLYAGYCAELLDRIPIDPNGAAPYFELLATTLDTLCEPGPARRLPLLRLRFELHLLMLLGYLPDFSRCAACEKVIFREQDGRAVPAQDAPHTFDVRLGGVRCPDCAAGERQPLLLHPGSLSFLQNWRLAATSNTATDADTAGSASVRPSRQALEELEAAVTRHLLHHIEREPRSLALLPTLDELEPG